MAVKVSHTLLTLLLVTAHASLSSELEAIVPSVTFLGVRGNGTLLAVQGNESSLPSAVAPKVDMTSATMSSMEAALTDLMLGKANGAKFGATPMGGSVKQIAGILTNTMMPKVIAAHKSDQATINRLAKEINKCGSTKNSALRKSQPSSRTYRTMSRFHQKCRSQEAVQRTSRNSCWSQRRALHRVKVLTCKHFATMAKNYGTQKNNRAIMKKAGSEKTEVYINRVSRTVCGRHVHGNRGNRLQRGGWGGGLPNSMLDKYLKAKHKCAQSKRNYNGKVRECKRKTRDFNRRKAQCNQYQGRMDGNSCKSAVMVKDACESYAGCYSNKKKAYNLFRDQSVAQETDRRAEWRGLKRMECLIKAFADGKISDAEVDTCKKKSHSTDFLKLKYPKIPKLQKCALPTLYPATGAYKRKEFGPLPNLAKGVPPAACAGIDAMPTSPRSGSPRGTKCRRVTLNGPFSAGGLVKCTNGFDVSKSTQKNSCPRGTKIFSPRTRGDWKTFLASAGPLRAPHWIIDVTRPYNGRTRGWNTPMNSRNRQQKTWTTSDGSAWWLRSTGYNEPNGDYNANCYLDLWHGKPRNENYVAFNDGRCNYHSKSYYCQPINLKLRPKAGSPRSCRCSKVDLTGKYSAGVLVKCEQCRAVRRSSEKNSCPNGMKIFSPASRADWKTFLSSAGPLRAPHWIVDVTRPQNGCGGCKNYPMRSTQAQQATWKTSDGSPWWLRSTRYNEPNGDYTANCFLNLWHNPASPDTVTFNDGRCNYYSRSYYCQPTKRNKNYGGHHRRRRAPKVLRKRRAPVKRRRARKAFAAPKGVQYNYDQMKLMRRGWKVWSDKPYSHSTKVSDIRPNKGRCILWGSKRAAGSTRLDLAAFGRRKALFPGGAIDRKIWENGVYWYMQPKLFGPGRGSVGFSASSQISLRSADVQHTQSKSRLSWHLYNRHVGGYRSGRKAGLNGNKTWRKIVMYGPCKGLKKMR